jgi:SM-20-related protein
LENDFEVLISSFLETKIGLSNHFLQNELANKLKTNLLELFDNKKFAKAGTGNAEFISQDTSVRSDSIFWLDRKHDNKSENEFLDLIDEFVRYLNMTCFTGITSYEFHYSMYEKGAFYKKHVDQFQNNSDRKYSMISYLNDNWSEQDGGQLLVHQLGNNQQINPTQGKTIFFKSNELEHEVLVTNKRRMSVTGWLKG